MHTSEADAHVFSFKLIKQTVRRCNVVQYTHQESAAPLYLFLWQRRPLVAQMSRSKVGMHFSRHCLPDRIHTLSLCCSVDEFVLSAHFASIHPGWIEWAKASVSSMSTLVVTLISIFTASAFVAAFIVDQEHGTVPVDPTERIRSCPACASLLSALSTVSRISLPFQHLQHFSQLIFIFHMRLRCLRRRISFEADSLGGLRADPLCPRIPRRGQPDRRHVFQSIIIPRHLWRSRSRQERGSRAGGGRGVQITDRQVPRCAAD